MLSVTMFLFGFGWATLYIPMIFFYILFYEKKLFLTRISLVSCFIWLSAIFFCLLVYVPAILRGSMIITHPLGSFIVLTVLTMTLPMVLSKLQENSFINMIEYFLFGLFLYVLMVVTYTTIVSPEWVVTRQLLNPFFLGKTYGTAGLSNYLIPVFCGFFYLMFFSPMLKKIAVAGILLIILVMETVLSGRAFWLIALLFIVLVLAGVKIRYKAFKYISVLCFFTLLLSFFIIQFPGVFDLVFLKFQENGMSSSRYLLWTDALNKMFEYPFGGFDVDQNIEAIHSYHNIVFDALKFGGWLAAVFFMGTVFLFILSILFLRKQFEHFYLIWGLIMVALLDMMQDAIIEGSYKFFVLYVVLLVFIWTPKERNKYG